MSLALVSGQSYTTHLVQSFMHGLMSEKEYRGYEKRSDGLIEDATGRVYTIDIKVTDCEVKVTLKQVNLVGF